MDEPFQGDALGLTDPNSTVRRKLVQIPAIKSIIEYFSDKEIGNAEFFKGIDINNASDNLPLPFNLTISDNQENIKKGHAKSQVVEGQTEDIARFTNEGGQEVLVKAIKDDATGKLVRLQYMNQDRKTIAIWEKNYSAQYELTSDAQKVFKGVSYSGDERIELVDKPSENPIRTSYTIEYEKANGIKNGGRLNYSSITYTPESETYTKEDIIPLKDSNKIIEWINDPKSAINEYNNGYGDKVKGHQLENALSNGGVSQAPSSAPEHFALAPSATPPAKNLAGVVQSRIV